MKRVIVMLVVSVAALVGMASTAAGLTSVQTGMVRGVGDGGGSDRYWGCAGNDTINQAVCIADPVPTSSTVEIQN